MALLKTMYKIIDDAPVRLLNLTIPRHGFRQHRGIAYGPDARQRLDIYVPDAPAINSPVIVFFYGGSWQNGRKEDYFFVGQALASKGFTTVIADYRLYPQVYFPDFVSDAAKAFVWTYENIAGYGGNPEQLFIGGHSAGAYLAVMVTLNETYLKAAGGDAGWIKGTIGISGPYNFLPLTDPKLIDLFSTVPLVRTQPITFARAGAPPMLLATGDEDKQVSPKNTTSLSARLREFGNKVVEHHYKGAGHSTMALSLARGFRSKVSVLDDIAEFIEQRTAQ